MKLHLKNKNELTFPDLTEHGLDVSTLKTILQDNHEINTLILKESTLSDVELQTIGEVLKENETISHLHMNKLGVIGLDIVTNLLIENKTLTHLFLGNTGIIDYDCNKIASALKANTSLTTLELDSNEIGDQ
eukprot:Awhi_evm1s14153